MNQIASETIGMATIDGPTKGGEKSLATVEIGTPEASTDSDSTKELPDSEAQRGVRQAEAVNLIWTANSMRFVFFSFVVPRQRENVLFC